MAYRIGATFKITSERHIQQERVIAGLAEIGAYLAEDAPEGWTSLYVVVVPVLDSALQRQAEAAKQEETLP